MHICILYMKGWGKHDTFDIFMLFEYLSFRENRVSSSGYGVLGMGWVGGWVEGVGGCREIFLEISGNTYM